MYAVLQMVHSYLAYIVLAVLFLAVANAIIGLMGNKVFNLQKDFRLSLFALIFAHTQLLVGLALFFYLRKWLEGHPNFGDGGVKCPFPTLGRGTPLYQYYRHYIDHHRLVAP